MGGAEPVGRFARSSSEAPAMSANATPMAMAQSCNSRFTGATYAPGASAPPGAAEKRRIVLALDVSRR
ncbi:hypothetical protein LBMAG42_06180 [Deltaproteobacteria bacterium]|nr:hypothetical protein LBMAG42_06180 [Deltaproteobacteria bacterium]